MDTHLFAERLKYFRSQKDLTQTQLADLVGITAKQISDYEVGRSKPRPATLFKIFNALEIDEKSFFDEKLFISDLVKNNEQMLSFTSNSDRTVIMPRQGFYYDPQHIIAHEHQGDSMNPTLNDGDLLLVNTDIMRIEHGKLHLIKVDDIPSIFRLYPNDNGTVSTKKDNDFYPAKTFSITSIDIIGKVIYRQGFL